MTPPELEQHLLDTIPLARAMQLRLTGYEHDRLSLQAPLAANRNDKGCAFGGSLASLMTLAGWGCAVLGLGERGDGAEVYVQDSEVRYLAPVWQSLVVIAWLDDGDNGLGFAAAYATRGRSRTVARAECRLDDGTVAARMSARFVAIDPARRKATPADGV